VLLYIDVTPVTGKNMLFFKKQRHLPESRNIGGCISDCFLDNGVPNTGNRRIAVVPIQRERQQTPATIEAGNFYTTELLS
jgi:hypothetical protein